MGHGVEMVAVLVFLAVVLVLGTLVGGIILRAAVSLYNKMAGGTGSETAVPEPSVGKAMGITFVTTLVNSIVGFLVGVLMGGAAGADGGGINTTAPLVSLVCGMFVMASMLSALLPTKFGRAILVTLCYFLIALVVFATVLVVLFVVSLALRWA